MMGVICDGWPGDHMPGHPPEVGVRGRNWALAADEDL